jgi:Uri superfamily endonuclease
LHNRCVIALAWRTCWHVDYLKTNGCVVLAYCGPDPIFGGMAQ